jgi:hypothetical protein
MPACKLKFTNKTKLSSISASVLAIVLSSNAYALEDGFMGLYAGSTSSLDADSTSNSFKILTGAHVTSRITLEFGYVNFGKTSYDDPTPVNTGNNKANISFKDGEHGSVSPGQLGDATVVTDGKNTYDNKGNAQFNGISEFETQGALINLRYRLPINNEFDFFVKTGFFAWAADYQNINIVAEQNGTITRTETKSSQTSGANTISGAGFIYRPIPQLSIRTELETTAISSIDMPRTRLQNITLGVNWEF